MARILICDEDTESGGALAGQLVELGHQVIQADSVTRQLSASRATIQPYFLLEPDLGERDGVDILKSLRQRGFELPVFAAAKLKSSLVAEAMQHGLKDFMPAG